MAQQGTDQVVKISFGFPKFRLPKFSRKVQIRNSNSPQVPAAASGVNTPVSTPVALKSEKKHEPVAAPPSYEDVMDSKDEDSPDSTSCEMKDEGAVCCEKVPAVVSVPESSTTSSIGFQRPKMKYPRFGIKLPKF